MTPATANACLGAFAAVIFGGCVLTWAVVFVVAWREKGRGMATYRRKG